MNHRLGRILFGLAAGLVVALFAFKWVTDPQPRVQRAMEERAVAAARTWLARMVEADDIEIVDPLAPDRKVGKVYVYEEPPGWAVSGFYRRDQQDRWHPYLITLDEGLELDRMKAKDSRLTATAGSDARLEVIP